jgi:acylphosphatase
VKIVRAIVTGKVQGVWFRAWTVKEAQKRNLRGWVQNLSDGSVEALFAGDPAMVEAMVKACHQGPPLAKVSNVAVRDASGEAVPENFAQRGAD